MHFHSSEQIKFHVKQIRKTKNWIKELIQSYHKQLGDINYIFQSDEELLELNKSALNHDYYTDIITFDYCDDTTISGDLFISIDRVKENALNFAVPFEHELRRVMAHGVLHLLGHKDKSESDSKKMRSAEDKALDLFQSFT
ncbi:MAG: rRNA maturation RNase YbeY [Bacteroidetes bacterium]|nr:MAG: rRNA maturation RNase YbeY [Bacteroidota bacterium]